MINKLGVKFVYSVKIIYHGAPCVIKISWWAGKRPSDWLRELESWRIISKKNEVAFPLTAPTCNNSFYSRTEKAPYKYVG
jgi:hypothetical protein